MSKRWLILSILLSCGALLQAGDLATFVNLGFSSDDAYFQFGEYGIEQGGGVYAEIYTVENARNAFVPGGVLKTSSPYPMELGQDGSGAFFNLLYENSAIARNRKIDHLRQGRLLYILMDGLEEQNELSFRDFKTGIEYGISLVPSVIEKGDQVQSSFSLDVTLTGTDAKSRTIRGGSPEVKRQGVSGYVIRRVILSPGEKSLVVVIEKKMLGKDGVSVRYMVETFKLK